MSAQHPEDIRSYQQVARAIEFIRAHAREQPGLETVARAVGMSPYHFQRLFARWAGISPKRFLQVLTRDHARSLLLEHGSMLEISHELGLSGPSRLHELMISCEAMTPGEIRSQGGGLSLRYARAVSPFGVTLLGWSERGVCHLSFEDEDSDIPQSARVSPSSGTNDGLVPGCLRSLLPAAGWIEDRDGAQDLVRRIFSGFAIMGANPAEPAHGVSAEPHKEKKDHRIHLLLKGTNYQVKVWEALIQLGDRPVVSYQQLARGIGQPGAQRAVASAVASNPIGWLIPCHHVIRQQGEFGQYRWGATRKQAMLGWEMASRR